MLWHRENEPMPGVDMLKLSHGMTANFDACVHDVAILEGNTDDHPAEELFS